MENNSDVLFYANNVDKHLDKLGKKALRLCAIPSFFTYHLIISCLPLLTSAPVSENWICHFLSLPFISRRTLRTGSEEIEYYLIHQIVKDSIPLSMFDYKIYGPILEQYFDKMCINAPHAQMDKYFYEKLLCELKMEECEPWKKAYQASMETNRRQECNKLLMLFQSSVTDGTKDWYIYYSLVNQYVNEVSLSELIPKVEAVLFAADLNNSEYIYYLRLFLGVLYDTIGRWQDAKDQYEKVVVATQESQPTSQNILAVTYVNLTMVCCHLSEFDSSGNYAKLAYRHISCINLGGQVAAYKATAFCAQKKYLWNKAYELYQVALQSVQLLQQQTSQQVSQVYHSFHPCPIYCSDVVGIYNRLGEILLLKGYLAEALEYHQKELRIQRLLENRTGIGWATYNIGKTEYLLGDTVSAKDMLTSSILNFRNSENERNQAYPLGELSYVFQYIGELENSFQCLQESVEILLNSEDIEKCLFYFNHLGRICQSQGFLSYAAQIFRLCIQYYQAHSKTDHIGWAYNNYARNFMFSGNYIKAEKYFERAREIFQERTDERGAAYVCNNIAELFAKTDRTLEAEKLFQESLLKKKAMGDRHAICYTHRELGELYLLLGQLEEAEKNLTIADQLCRAGNYRMLEGDINVSFGKLRQQQKSYECAFKCFELAFTNYNKQNFLTRMINCCYLEGSLAEQIGELELAAIKRQTAERIHEKKRKEECFMIDSTETLMEKIKDFIAVDR